MKTLKYVFKNLKVTLKKSPVIFGLYVICCVVSVFVVLFSHGVYQNYKVKTIGGSDENLGPNGLPILGYSDVTFGNLIEETLQEHNGYEPYYQYVGDGKSTLGQFRQVLALLDEKTKTECTGFAIFYDIDCINTDEYRFDYPGFEKFIEENYLMLESRLEYDKQAHAYGLYNTFVKNSRDSFVAGSYLSQEQEVNGEHVIVIPKNDEIKNQYDMIGETVRFLGQQYEVIGVHHLGYTVPFATIPDDLTFDSIGLLVDKPMTTYAYRHLKDAFEKVYGDYVNFPELYTIDETEQTFYVSIMMISVVLSALSAIILAILYRYIIFTRRKTMSILRLNGCTRFRIRIMYLIEIMGTSIAIFAGCAYAYHKLILPKLTLMISRIAEVYSFNTYVYVFAVFVSVLFVVINIMISLQLDKQPVDMFKRR